MKRYRLLVNIPGQKMIYKAGNIISYDEVHKNYCSKDYCGESTNEYIFDANIVENHPEFFEEITRWKPEMNGVYEYLNPEGQRKSSSWQNDIIDKKRYDYGNVFPIQSIIIEEAQRAIQKLLLSLHDGTGSGGAGGIKLILNLHENE